MTGTGTEAGGRGGRGGAGGSEGGAGGRGGAGGTTAEDAGVDSGRVLGPRQLADGAAEVAAGESHTCLRLTDGSVRCWGNSSDGRTGVPDVYDPGGYDAPYVAGEVDIGGTAVQVVAGSDHACVLLDDAAVRCWGRSSGGALGVPGSEHIGDDEVPATAPTVDLGDAGAVQISAGAYHTCAVMADGSLYCWGGGTEQFGQTGRGAIDVIGDDETPFEAGPVVLPGKALQVSAGVIHTCAVIEGGEVYCWGAGELGQLGHDELPTRQLEPGKPVALGAPAQQVSAGAEHSCALLDVGTVRCWGNGRWGQLGYGDTHNVGGPSAKSPAEKGDVDLGGQAASIDVGAEHSCALLENGTLRCWGSNVTGALGNAEPWGDIGAFDTPAGNPVVDLGDTAAVQLSAGLSHNCVVRDDTGVMCWGLGADGRLGYGNLNDIGDNEPPQRAGTVQFLDPYR